MCMRTQTDAMGKHATMVCTKVDEKRKVVEFRPYVQRMPELKDEEFEFTFKEHPPAKSSTSVLKATVCQLCGHPLDGKKNGAGSRSYSRNGGPCDCMCHKGA